MKIVNLILIIILFICVIGLFVSNHRTDREIGRIKDLLEAREFGNLDEGERISRQNRAKARQLYEESINKYGKKLNKEIETLYQVGNKQYGEDTAVVAMKAMYENYPEHFRTGCAVLYLGQMTTGEESERWLRLAIEKYNDSYYFDGVQVGSYARFMLAGKLLNEGRDEAAKALYQEIVDEYPKSINHRAILLVDLIRNGKLLD